MAKKTRQKEKKKVVIIGGGITGLTAAYEIKKGIQEENLLLEVVLIEKNEKLGGTFTTERTKGFLIEGGPDSFEIYKPAPLELAKELGIEDSVIGGNEEHHRTFIYSQGKLKEIPHGLLGLVPDKISSLIFCSLLSAKARMRASLELFIPPLKQKGTEVSIGEFYKRRFGQEIFEVIAEPLFGSIYACIPEMISLKTCWPRGLALEQEYGSLLRGMLARRKEAQKSQDKKGAGKASFFMTFKNGMSELTEALVKKIGQETFLTGRKVESVEFNSKKKKFLIHLGKRKTMEADFCFIATSPSYETANLVRKIDPAISDMLLRIPYVSSATVSLGFKKEVFGHPLDGFGLLVARTENKNIKAVSWSSTKFAGRAPKDHVLLRCFVGNAQDETIVYQNDKKILDVVLNDLKDIMGVTAKPILTRIYRWRNAMAQYTLGHGERVAFIEERLKNFPGLFLIGNAYRGVGVGDCINDAKQAVQMLFQQL
jgi:oxygen-dependent protoporphyrinogen oxidase